MSKKGKKENKISKKEKKKALKESKKYIKDIFDKLGQGSPLSGVDILIIPKQDILEYHNNGKFISEESLSSIESPGPDQKYTEEDNNSKTDLKNTEWYLDKSILIINKEGTIKAVPKGKMSEAQQLMEITIAWVSFDYNDNKYQVGHDYWVNISDWKAL